MSRIWMDGELLPRAESRVSVLAHTLHYGVGVFEGIRSYARADGSAAVFRLDDHLRRLSGSAQVCGLELPYTLEQLHDACLETLEACELRDGYLRPLVYQDDANLGGLGSMPPVHVAIAAQAWGAYLGEEGLRKGIRVHISSYRRAPHGSFLSKAKVCGPYVISTLAKREALRDGWDEALLTDEAGFIAEGSGENLFMVTHGSLVTPPRTAPILPGLTRDTVLKLAAPRLGELGLEAVEERNITRDELLTADEIFLTGTAAEVTPIREVDGTTIGAGSAGPVTRVLQDAFFDVVRGDAACPAGWRTPFGALVR